MVTLLGTVCKKALRRSGFYSPIASSCGPLRQTLLSQLHRRGGGEAELGCGWSLSNPTQNKLSEMLYGLSTFSSGTCKGTQEERLPALGSPPASVSQNALLPAALVYKYHSIIFDLTYLPLWREKRGKKKSLYFYMLLFSCPDSSSPYLKDIGRLGDALKFVPNQPRQRQAVTLQAHPQGVPSQWPLLNVKWKFLPHQCLFQIAEKELVSAPGSCTKGYQL